MEPINDPEYWKRRLERASAGALHRSVFICGNEKWLAIEAKHKEILAKYLKDGMWILDAGCGYGRLIDLLPINGDWFYNGVDLSPDMIKRARESYLYTPFIVGDLRDLPYTNQSYDIAVMISIRPMVKRNLGDEEWTKMEQELRRVAKKLLYLEYDETDEGSLE